MTDEQYLLKQAKKEISNPIIKSFIGVVKRKNFEIGQLKAEISYLEAEIKRLSNLDTCTKEELKKSFIEAKKEELYVNIKNQNAKLQKTIRQLRLDKEYLITKINQK